MKRLSRKIRNFFRNFRYFLSGFLLHGYLIKLPNTLIIEPSNICNLHCSCCPHGYEKNKKRPAGFMSRQIFDKILDNIDIPVKKVCLYLHGEPFLNRDLDYFVRQLNQRKILTTIYSNGYNTDLELLEKILKHKRTVFSFSADILNKEHYEQIRQPAKYEKMIGQLVLINRIFEANRRKFEITMIANSENFENMHELCKKLFTNYGCLTKISFGSKFPWPEHFYTGELNKRLSKKRKFCSQINGNISVYWDGKATMCSFDFSGELVIGDLLAEKLSEVYNSQAARKIRTWHYMRRYSKVPVCQKCILPRYRSSSRVLTRRQLVNYKQIIEKQ
jgi:radical SAM protein with 4Fe4S-binding SPASM domain